MRNIPDKIYLNLNMTPQEVVETKDQDFHEATKTWEITWSEDKQSEHDPEYIRKDAFIERTEEFIYLALNDGIMGTANIEDFMRLLKKYIEE